MAQYAVDQMFNSTGESTSLADLNLGTTTNVGSYAPTVPGRLVRVFLMWAGDAASSLMEFIRVELSSGLWTPNLQRFGMMGAGLRTAPAFPLARAEWVVDLPVEPNQGIKGQYIHAAGSPVTSNLYVFGTIRYDQAP